MAFIKIPPDFIELALDRLAAIGASPADKRDAVAILALVVAGLDPQSYATSRKGPDLAARLGLDLGRWRDVIRLLERADVLSRVRRRGQEGLAIRPPGEERKAGRQRAYAPPESRTDSA